MRAHIGAIAWLVVSMGPALAAQSETPAQDDPRATQETEPATCAQCGMAVADDVDVLTGGPLCVHCAAALADDPHDLHRTEGGHHQHGSLPPIGVMGAHVHPKGSWMVSYRWMRMNMTGNRDGTNGVSTSEVLADYPVAPRKMRMDMHMIGLMYGLTDDLTLATMVPILDINMDHVTGTGVEFDTDSDGLGDVRVTGIYKLFEEGKHQVLLNGGVSIPTGGIDEKDDTPASGGANVKLPYPMQLGSGTWDLLPGATYLYDEAPWSFGAQFIQTFRLGENDEDYRLGNRSDLTAWVSRSFGPATPSIRVTGMRWGDIHGSDDDLNPNIVPTADPDLRGGHRWDVGLGLSLESSKGKLAGHRLGVEWALPFYQDLDGPQLETDWVLTVGWTYQR